MAPILRSLRRYFSRVRLAGWLSVVAFGVPGQVAQAQAGATDQVCFYEHDGYGGRQLCVAAGGNNMPAGWNDLTSSVKVPAGWKVELLADTDFKGRSLVLTTDTASLGALSFNDTASSYRVTAPPRAAATTAVAQPVSTLCSGTHGAASELPLSAVGIERSVSLPTDRKRVAVNCIADAKNPAGPRLNVLRSDQGSALRAGTSWVWKPDEVPGRADPAAFFGQMRKAGLNAVRVIAFDVWEAEAYGGQYLRNFDDPAFLLKLRGLLETAVNNCSRYGMYCIINAHNKIDSFNPAINQKFWKVMAPYFANRTHVLYEQANEPWGGSGIGANYAFAEPATLAALRSGYNEMRAAASNTHIMILTPTGINGWGYVDAMAHVAQLFENQPGPAIDWTKTSVAYHLYATDRPWGSPNAENLRNLHSHYPGFPSENNFPQSVSNATLNITDSWRSDYYTNELYINQTSEILGLGWSLWNIESAAQLTRNFPLIVNDATTKGYVWKFDAKVPGELTP